MSFACVANESNSGAISTQHANQLATDRKAFKRAWALLKGGNITSAATLIKQLEHYPLYPYLKAAQLRPRLQKNIDAELIAFLQEFEGAYPAERLRSEWLTWLAESEQWAKFAQNYRPQSDTVLACHHKTALLKTAAKDNLFSLITPLWLVGKSQPAACDLAFKYYEGHEAFDDPVVWQRFRLAIANNEIGLARHLAKKLQKAHGKQWAERWLEAHTNPNKVLKKQYVFDDNLIARDVLFHALGRLAKANFESAQNNWSRIVSADKFSATELNHGNAILAIEAAKTELPDQIFYLDQVENRFASADLEAYRLRRGIQLQAWEPLHRWTSQPPRHSDTNPLRWQYWHARSAQLLGKHEEALKGFKALAKERDYYGFVAADQAQLPYHFNYVAVDPLPQQLDAVRESPGIRRALEFLALDLLTDANREWTYTTKSMPKADLEIAALLAAKQRWHNRAIATLGYAKSFDDIVIRFPLEHGDEINKNSQAFGLEEAIIYSIIRTESAFFENARSSAGALGLMQLMPATGREAGKKIGMTIKHPRELLDPKKNIRIGTSFLTSLLRRYSGSLPMAAAAYNAGPHRVRQWRPAGDCQPADVWIDSIPFRETRRYVRTALFYYVVYQHRMEKQIKPLSNMMQAIPPSGGVGTC